MDDKHRDILRRHWSSLRRNLEPVKLLPYLVKVLDITDEQEVKVKATREARTDKLLEILPRRGPKAFDDFVKALQEVQPFLAVPLLQEAEMGEMKTELSRARTHSARLREEVQIMRTGLEKEQQKHKTTLKELEELRSLHETLMEKGKYEKHLMETRLKELDTTVKHLKEELLAEKTEKEVFIEEMTRLRELCDQLASLERQRTVSFHDRATSPGEPMQLEFDNFEVELKMATGAPDKDKPMDEKYRNILMSVRVELVRDMNLRKVLRHMAAAHVFEQEDADIIKTQGSREEQCEKFLDLLPTRGAKAYSSFIEALKKDQLFLAEVVIEAEYKKLNAELTIERQNSTDLEKQVRPLKSLLEFEREEKKKIEGRCQMLKAEKVNFKKEIKTLTSKSEDHEKQPKDVKAERDQEKKEKELLSTKMAKLQVDKLRSKNEKTFA